MGFSLKFDTDNAAFTDNGAAEVTSILRKVANQVRDGREFGPVFDANGNKVGDWSLELPEPDEEEKEDDGE